MLNLKIIKRYCILLTGLFFMGLGISLTTKSNLGTTPISSVPYVLSLIFPLTFGEFTFLLCLLCVIIQIFIVRKKFPKKQYLQVIVGLVFGSFVDLGMRLLAFVNPDTYVEKLIGLLLGSLVLAWGIYLEVSADVIINPGEGIVKTIAETVGKEFGTIKVIFDSVLFLTALIISLSVFGTVRGLREGTIVSAILVGFLTKIYHAIFKHFNLELWFTK